MKDSKLFSINNKKIKTDNSYIKQLPNRYKTNLISIKSIPNTQIITGSKSFRQQTHYFTQKNSKEKDKNLNMVENESFDLNSKINDKQKLKRKNSIINKKNFFNYNNQNNSNFLNYANSNSNSIYKNKSKLHNNGKKLNFLHIQKIEEEPQQLRINTVNNISPTFCITSKNSIKKQKDSNFKLISSLTGWNSGYKGIIKGYNTANNTANNSLTGSMEKIEKKEFKSRKNNKKLVKEFSKSKDAIRKVNKNNEFNLLLRHNKKFKNAFVHTTNNSRQNSGEKYFESSKSKLLGLKYNKLFLKNFRDLNTNNFLKNNYIKNKQISAQTTLENKINKNFLKKSSNNSINNKIDSKGIIIKSKICQTKNHILRKKNQDSIKISHTNAKEKIKVTNLKLNNDNLNNNYLNSNINLKPNLAFSTRQNLIVAENSQIKVNKSNKMINSTNYNNSHNNIKGIIKSKFKNKNIKNIDIFNVDEESLEIINNQNQKIFPTSYFFNKVNSEINKKIMTAGNSPGKVKIKKLISPDIISHKQKIGEKIFSFQNVKNITSKESIKKINNELNLKSAHITRKNSENKELKKFKNIKTENKSISKQNLKYDFFWYNYSHPNNSLRSNNSSEENNNSFIDSNYNSKNNISNNLNNKNFKKIFNFKINEEKLKYKKNKQLIQKNKDINILDNIQKISKGIQIKYNSSNNSKYKISNKSTNINITNSPISKTKYSNLYDKKKVEISDIKFQSNENCKNNISREKSAGILKQKQKINKKKLIENQKAEKMKKSLINKTSNNINRGNINNVENNYEKIKLNVKVQKEKEKEKEKEVEKESNKLIDKDKIEELLLIKENHSLSKKINIVKEDDKNENEEELMNCKNNNENSSKLTISKIAKKSSHNRNIEQNFIFNSNTNTSLLTTMKDSNYYSQESENLSKYIKDYFNTHSCYPPTDVSFYKFGRIIGRGAFGKVNIGLNILTGRIVAIKSFNKNNLVNEKAKKKILYETNLMRGLYHPAVTKILETFETEKYMLIIMEYISGGNLQNFVKKRRKLCEKTAKILFSQLIQGIKYIHSKGIVHRDIKLENILLDLNNIVKICDFGVGKLTQKGQKLLDQCGTPVYMAPEIIQGEGYEGFPVDVWSAGVALYIMLSGNIPFNRDKTHDLQSAIINLPYKKIEDISESANDLLEKILEKDPSKRYTPEQILEHPWMNEPIGNDDDGFDYNYDLEIKNVNKYHLFTNAESILLAKTHIDYRKAPKKDLAENFTIKNLYTLEDKKNNKNVETKSIILAPYNSMLTDSEEEEEEDDDDDKTKEIKKKKNKNKLEKSEDIKIKAMNYYNQSTNPYDILDNFNLELQIKNGIMKFHGKVKESNMNYELNNNEEIDNGMLINSKDELVLEETNNENNNNKKEEQLENYIKINNKKDINKAKKNHRPNSPYKQPPINNYFVKMVCDLGYDENYVVKSLEKNELNHATTIYYLFSNYENIK